MQEWRSILRKHFASYFFGKSKYIPPIVRTLSTMLFKKVGLVLKYPLTSANEKYQTLLLASSKLVGSVRGERKFSPPLTFWRSRKKGVTDKEYGW